MAQLKHNQSNTVVTDSVIDREAIDRAKAAMGASTPTTPTTPTVDTPTVDTPIDREALMAAVAKAAGVTPEALQALFGTPAPVPATKQTGPKALQGDDTMLCVVMTPGRANPKLMMSKGRLCDSYRRFNLYTTAGAYPLTKAEALKAGLTRIDFTYDTDHGFVRFMARAEYDAYVVSTTPATPATPATAATATA